MTVDEEGGLYDKYEIRKNGEVVENCFVLEPEDDPAARVALAAYAGHTDDEELCSDLNEWLADIWRAEMQPPEVDPDE